MFVDFEFLTGPSGMAVYKGTIQKWVIETPQPNLSLGMKGLLGTYTQRFNRRHRHWGHLFGGRYKAQLIDGRSPGYLRAACDYVHLNPVRAGIVRSGQKLDKFRWSSARFSAQFSPAFSQFSAEIRV